MPPNHRRRARAAPLRARGLTFAAVGRRHGPEEAGQAEEARGGVSMSSKPTTSQVSATLAQVQLATVQIQKKGGRGVLVPGGFVLTAAHCVEWSPEGGMVLGDF